MKSKRTELYKVIPLEMPYLVQIFPCYACNFKCMYCLHALPREEHGFISNKIYMDFDLYKRAIDDMVAAGYKVKMVRFAAIGEPLLHPRIADMVAYAVEKQIAERVDIVTNASLLTEDMSDTLIRAGLSTLRVSLEGLSSDEYEDNCGIRVDYEMIKHNIAYFYTHAGESQVYVKIIDYMIKGSAEREQLFYDTFTPISHVTAIEHLTPTVEGIDFKKIADGTDLALTQDGATIRKARICPQPFYILQINPDGDLTVCCSVKYPGIFGNVDATGVANVWNGTALTVFRKKMLQEGAAFASDACAQCTLYQYGLNEEDLIDGHEEEILQRLKGYRNGFTISKYMYPCV
jgi:MoaA/NifB/PqqE/SkfB family radical SAM enzyme